MATERPCPFCRGTGKHRDLDPHAARDLRWMVASDRVTGSHVSLVGEVTEQAVLDGIAKLPRPVVLDLSGVRYINTAGSLVLVRLVEQLTGSVFADRCSPAVVRQLNLLPDFSDHISVRSVVVPLECPSCHTEHRLDVDVGRTPPDIQLRQCGACGVAMEPDEPLDSYFAFVNA